MQVSNKQFYVTTKSNDGSTFIHATMYQLMPRFTLTLDNNPETSLGEISEYIGNMFNIDPKNILYKDEKVFSTK